MLSQGGVWNSGCFRGTSKDSRPSPTVLIHEFHSISIASVTLSPAGSETLRLSFCPLLSIDASPDATEILVIVEGIRSAIVCFLAPIEFALT